MLNRLETDNQNKVRKAESISKLIVLLFLGIALQSVIVFPQVWGMLKQNQPPFFTIDVIALYWLFAILYSLVMTLFLDSRTFISPFYIQIGTSAFFAILVMIQAVILIPDIPNLVGVVIALLFVQFAPFMLVGYGLTFLFRRITGMYADPSQVCNKTYRIDCDYNMAKQVFKSVVFKRFDREESEEKNRFVLKRKRMEIRTLILLEPDNKNPSESIISISTCEIKYDSIWKTDKAEDELKLYQKLINADLDEMYSRRLIFDENEKLVSNRCKMELLETMESKLTSISKLPKKTALAIAGLLLIGAVTTALKFAHALPFHVPIVDWNTLISVWAIVVSTIFILNQEEIRARIKKKELN